MNPETPPDGLPMKRAPGQPARKTAEKTKKRKSLSK